MVFSGLRNKKREAPAVLVRAAAPPNSASERDIALPVAGSGSSGRRPAVGSGERGDLSAGKAMTTAPLSGCGFPPLPAVNVTLPSTGTRFCTSRSSWLAADDPLWPARYPRPKDARATVT